MRDINVNDVRIISNDIVIEILQYSVDRDIDAHKMIKMIAKTLKNVTDDFWINPKDVEKIFKKG